jgi:imidazole glycerol phosphate synthase glutamine amidotransferase subunit
MTRLRKSGLGEAIVARIESGAPTLAICLGMQLLCSASEEAPEASGLDVVSGRLRRFPNSVRTPQMGWNEVAPEPACELVAPGHAYFANSYRLSEAPAGWSLAWTNHGGPFISALERGAVLACQFHPELSGRWGLDLLDRWLARATAAREVRC